MKKFYDILCKALFMSIVVLMTTIEVLLLNNWHWFSDLIWQIENEAVAQYLVIIIMIGLYYLNKTIIWKAITHFNTK
jgi:hypothetical protein